MAEEELSESELEEVAGGVATSPQPTLTAKGTNRVTGNPAGQTADWHTDETTL